LSGGTKTEEDMLKKLAELKNKDNKLNFLVHSYFPPPVSNFVLNFADTSNQTRGFITKSMEYVKELNIPYYSIHAGFKKDFQIKNEILEDGKGSFVAKNIQENIDWFYDNYIEKLALENLFPNGQNETCFASHIDEIVELLKSDARVFLLLDLGHLKVSSRFYKFNYLEAVNLLFEKYSHRILEIHLSENDGVEDSHFIIQSDSIQYMILEKFRKNIIENNINLVIEAREYSLEKLKECYNLIQKIGEEK
jgi:sugar phosphate isomerase/epimerase